MTDIADRVLALLRAPGDVLAWAAVLAPDATHETLGGTLGGRDAVAERMASAGFADLDWARLDRPGIILAGTSPARRIALTIWERDGLVTGIGQQGLGGGAPRPGSPMVLDSAIRERLDTALARGHAMSIAYVDPQGRPHLSMRGSIMSWGPDCLVLWARAGSGLATAIPSNPHVALMYRDPVARSTYLLSGRARIVADEATRKAIFDAMPVIEQRHDFAMLGAAILIDLDLVEGHAGFGPTGAMEPVRLVRGAEG